MGNLLRKVWNFSPTMGKEDGLLGKALAFATCLCPIAATRSARVHLSVYEGRAGGVRSRHAATHSSSNFRRAFIFRFMKDAQGMYGRGMPRPIAAVTFAERSSFGLRGSRSCCTVAACRDRTPPLPHSSSNFRSAFYNGKSMGRGMPRQKLGERRNEYLSLFTFPLIYRRKW